MLRACVPSSGPRQPRARCRRRSSAGSACLPDRPPPRISVSAVAPYFVGSREPSSQSIIGKLPTRACLMNGGPDPRPRVCSREGFPPTWTMPARPFSAVASWVGQIGRMAFRSASPSPAGNHRSGQPFGDQLAIWRRRRSPTTRRPMPWLPAVSGQSPRCARAPRT